MKTKLLMVGERRSGTNLLRMMLGANKQIVAPHMVALLEKMMPLTSFYAEAAKEEALKQMIEDARQLINLVPVQWRGPELSTSSLAPLCRSVSFVSVLGALMQRCTEQAAAPIWMHKEPRALQWHNQIEAELGEVAYIYLCRDPRDVVVSFSRIADGDKHPYAIAKHWAEIQQLCLDGIEKVPENRVHMIRYEDLVRSPEDVLTELCKFIGIDFSESMLQFHRKDEAQSAANHGDHWGKLNQPVTQASVAKYVSALTEEQIQMVESVAGSTMERLGYTRSLPPREFSASDIQSFVDENSRMKQEVLDKGGLPHIQAQRAFLEQIKTRQRERS